jgi:hypothetical protein
MQPAEQSVILGTVGTHYAGLGFDERPEQGASSLPYLTLRELAVFVTGNAQSFVPVVRNCSTKCSTVEGGGSDANG